MADKPDNSGSIERLTGAQAARIAAATMRVTQDHATEQQRQTAVALAAQEMILRQWCIEQANVFCASAITPEQNRKAYELYDIAQSILEFVMTPTKG